MNVGVNEDQAERIEHQIGDDGAVIAVHPEERREEVLAILNRFTATGTARTITGQTDLESTTESGSTAEAISRTERAAMPPETVEGERHVELHEERLDVEKETEQVGEVVAHKEVITEPRTIEVPIRREEVVVERHPVPEGHQEVAPGDVEIREGEEIRIPVTEERVEVEKRPVVREEVTIGKRTRERRTVQENLRKENSAWSKKGKPTSEPAAN